jgi:gliding motility-associated-like protein
VPYCKAFDTKPSLIKPILALSFLLFSTVLFSQTCPPNIDFESGSFNGWTCYTGSTAAVNNANVITLSQSGAIPDRHTMFSRSQGLTDPYGGFPVTSPNGSGYSVRLGNEQGGAEAEAISYEFTIPAGQDVYSLIYYYAVVFQDPAHLIHQQPRMQVEIQNLTDGTTIDCSSFSFVPFGSPLPGFFQSSVTGSDGTPVWCKDWSAVTINLNGMAGKTIRLYFKTADCTFRRHFGYAYIDVNTECSDEFVGARFCPDDTLVNVVAPYGYQSYTWYNSSFTQVLGNEQNLVLRPPPPTGTTVSVVLQPYSGYGCSDTLHAQLLDNLEVVAEAGDNGLSCNNSQVFLGVNPKPGLVYNWTPATGLSASNISNPIASPSTTTQYVLTVNNIGGGCRTTDTVLITGSVINDSMQLIGKDLFCITSNDSAVLLINDNVNVQWYLDNRPIAGANSRRYRVPRSGSYYAILQNSDGCQITTDTRRITIETPQPGIRYPEEYAIVNLPLTLDARRIGSSILWQPSTYLDQAASFTPVFRGPTDQQYFIRQQTDAGCVTVDTLQVKTVKSAEIYVPSAFTPDSDGLNDILRPVLMGFKELRYFRVFNRWGQLIFETKANGKGWDGRINGLPQATGAYVWIAEGIGVDGKTYQRKGTSVLIR